MSVSVSPSLSPSVSPSPMQGGFKPHFTVCRFYGKVTVKPIKITPKFGKPENFRPTLKIGIK